MGEAASSRRTWSDLFAATARPDAPAVVTENGTWTARDLMAAASHAVEWLDARGVPAGRPIAALIATRPHSFSLAMAGLATNRPLAPLGPRLTHRELEACLAALDASMILVDAEFEEHALRLGKRCELPVACVPEFETSRDPIRLASDPRWPAAILHTSGTSGIPKPVAYRQDRLALRTERNGRILGLGPGCLYATASPFHHIAGLGMLFVALGSGAAVLPMAKFSADAWQELIDRGVTHGLLVPSMIEQLLAENRLVAGSLRVLQYGASQIHPETLQRMFAALPGIDIVQIYGQTEGSPITCLTPGDHRAAAQGAKHLLRSAGRAAEGVELRIDALDASYAADASLGSDVSYTSDPSDGRRIGEVVARADHFFKPSDDGWLHTGDLGWLDEAGYLYLVGRKGDMIIRGGENVHPQEVEQVLAEHPAVREAAVIGVPDKRLGEIVRAYVVAVDPDSPPAAEELRRHARASLAGYKVPVEWHFMKALPRNAAGKVLRRELPR